ncbi:hypothetical protein J6A31_05675 [bacterium]|nr:hypothetical protein [bacterium]
MVIFLDNTNGLHNGSFQDVQSVLEKFGYKRLEATISEVIPSVPDGHNLVDVQFEDGMNSLQCLNYLVSKNANEIFDIADDDENLQTSYHEIYGYDADDRYYEDYIYDNTRQQTTIYNHMRSIGELLVKERVMYDDVGGFRADGLCHLKNDIKDKLMRNEIYTKEFHANWVEETSNTSRMVSFPKNLDGLYFSSDPRVLGYGDVITCELYNPKHPFKFNNAYTTGHDIKIDVSSADVDVIAKNIVDAVENLPERAVSDDSIFTRDINRFDLVPLWAKGMSEPGHCFNGKSKLNHKLTSFDDKNINELDISAFMPAFKSTYSDGSSITFLKNDADEYLCRYNGPLGNFVYADKDFDIGVMVAADGRRPQFVPLDKYISEKDSNPSYYARLTDTVCYYHGDDETDVNVPDGIKDCRYMFYGRYNVDCVTKLPDSVEIRPELNPFSADVVSFNQDKDIGPNLDVEYSKTVVELSCKATVDRDCVFEANESLQADLQRD